MQPDEFLDFLGRIEALKGVPRHSWTSSGQRETVAAHSWRLAVMALLLRGQFPLLDMNRVLAMCLVHDWGEAITGDIPAFWKTEANEQTEDDAVLALLAALPAPLKGEYTALFAEMRALQTPEARLWRALDKLEAVIQHNEADVATWLPLEHELQLSYGTAEAEEFPFLRAVRARAAAISRAKSQGTT